jgi:hypothetical protein
MNEGVFDKLATMFPNVKNLFMNHSQLQTSIDNTMETMGESKTSKFIPKQVRVNDTFLIQMADSNDENVKFSIAFIKLADFPDGSGLFQIAGTTSLEMLKALVNSENIDDLTKNNVMAIIPQGGFTKGKPATMRLLKNIIPNGKDYVTKTKFNGAVPSAPVELNISKMKK